MSPTWEFEYSVDVNATREAAWAFWSNVANWTSIDPAVEWVRIDGPFEAGAHGETKPVGAPPNQWRLVEVDPPVRAVIEIPVAAGAVRFTWTLRDRSVGGATLTQLVELIGDGAGQYVDALQGLAAGIPAGMKALAAAIDRLAVGPPS